MQITPLPCLTDNYAYIINDNNSKTIGVVDPSEAQRWFNLLPILPTYWSSRAQGNYRLGFS